MFTAENDPQPIDLNAAKSTAAVWRGNPDLMARLAIAQNHEANIRQDIMTFAAFFDTRAELEAHVERYERRVSEYHPPARRRRIA